MLPLTRVPFWVPIFDPQPDLGCPESWRPFPSFMSGLCKSPSSRSRMRPGHIMIQGSLKDTCCPFEAWLFPAKIKVEIYKAMLRCIM